MEAMTSSNSQRLCLYGLQPSHIPPVFYGQVPVIGDLFAEHHLYCSGAQLPLGYEAAACSGIAQEKYNEDENQHFGRKASRYSIVVIANMSDAFIIWVPWYFQADKQ